MSIVKIGDLKDESLQPTTPRIYNQSYRHHLVDSRYTPHRSLLSSVTGIARVCDYYRGFYGADEETKSLQLNDVATYQQYTVIRNLVFKQESQATNSFDDDNMSSLQSFNLYLIFDLTPNIRDLLIVDMGDGRAGLFEIDAKPEYKTINADKVYYCSATLLSYVTQDIMDNLNTKTVQTFYYSKDSALAGGNAVLTEQDFNLNKQLDKQKLVITQYIAKLLTYNPEDTIVIDSDFAGNPDMIYDPYLTEFLSWTIPLNLVPGGNPINILPIQTAVRYGYTKKLTIWDCFKQNNFDLLPVLPKALYELPTKAFFNGFVTYDNIYYSAFNKVLWTDPQATEIINVVPTSLLGSSLSPENSSTPIASGNIENSNINPVIFTYAFSNDFYEGGRGISLYENTVYDVFIKNVYNKDIIYQLCKDWLHLSNKEKLYQAGVLILMINLAKRNHQDF